MANSNGQFNGAYNLSPNQQGLLLAALNSNNRGRKDNSSPAAQQDPVQPPSDSTQSMSQFSFDAMDPTFFMNDQSNLPVGNFDTPLGTLDESPYMDLLDGNDPDFDFDLPDGQMIGALPDSEDYEGNGELHDKRKSPEDDEEDNENGGKRREGEDKTAKKPGRKPLTSEPTSVSTISFPVIYASEYPKCNCSQSPVPGASDFSDNSVVLERANCGIEAKGAKSRCTACIPGTKRKTS
jgi:AP-1-like factor